MSSVNPLQAVEVMRRAGVEPQVPYPGAGKPWLSTCVACQREVSPRYNSIKQGQRGCRGCARERLAIAQRVPVEVVQRAFREAGYEPLDDYIGTDTPLRSRCTTCQRESHPTYSNVKYGYRCQHCARDRQAERQRLDPDHVSDVMRTAGLEPLDDYPGAAEAWRCRCLACGREVSPSYHSIQKGNKGCKYCARKAVDPAEAVEVMRRAGVEPREPYPGTDKQPWSSDCRICGEKVSPSYQWVRSSGNGCRHCSKRHAAQARRLEHRHAATVMRAHGFEPVEDYPGSAGRWACKHSGCDRIVWVTYSAVRAGGGCASCHYDRVAERRRLDPVQTTEMMRAAGLDPLEDYPGAAAAWRCRCQECGREVTPMYNSIKQGQGGCGYCAGRMVDPAEAAEVMQAAGLEPLEDYPGARTPWLCHCGTCGHRIRTQYHEVRRGHGCAYCWEQRRGDALRLDPMVAAEAMRAIGLEPRVNYPGADRPWPCRCRHCGEESSPAYASVRDGHGCRHCASHRRGLARRHAHDDAVAVLHLAGIDPLEDYPGAGVPWNCRCRTCLREISPTYAKVRDGGGCRYCSTTGIDLTKPGLLYLMHSREFGAYKIGITAVSVSRHDRIRQHQSYGWTLLRTLPCATAEAAWQIERAVLHRLDHNASTSYLSAECMPQGGHTETVDDDLFSPLEIWAIVRDAAASLPPSDQQRAPDRRSFT